MKVISPLFLHYYFDLLYWKQRQAFKANGSVAEPITNGNLANKELVAHPAYFCDVLQAEEECHSSIFYGLFENEKMNK
jgi:hypothetical protein